MKESGLQRKKWLFLPIEVKAREFEAKVLLSCFAAEEGWGVFIGKNNFNLKLNGVPQGVYMDKSIAPNKHQVLAKQVSSGNILVCLDEEGVVYKSEDEFCRQRLSEENLAITSKVFAWGHEQCRIMKDFSQVNQNKFVITGNARMDLLRPEFRGFFQKKCDRIRDQFGSYVLIPSNFSAPNHACGPNFIVEQFKACGYAEGEEELALLTERISYQRRIFESFLEMLPVLSHRFPKINFVVRPHPGDNHEVWQKSIESLPNVFSVFEGSSTAWIMGAEAIIHNSCTSAVEASALGIPVIAYMPEVDERFEQNIPNPISQRVTNLEQLSGLLERELKADSRELCGKEKEIMDKHISSLDGAFACEKIVRALDELEVVEQALPPDFDGKSKKFNLSSIKQLAKKLISQYSRFYRKNLVQEKYLSSYTKTYNTQKFSGISTEEINGTISAFKKLSGKFNEVNAKPVNKDCFLIVNTRSNN